QNDIIGKQQSLLERLDEPLNTQLTGSNVEDGIPVKQVSSGVDYEQKINEVILAGAEKIVFSEQNLKIDEVFFLVEGVNPHDFSIRVVTKAYSFDGRYHQTLNENSEGKYSAAIERFKNNLHNISFRVKNN